MAVAGFRECKPEVYSSFDAFWSDEWGPGNNDASAVLIRAFKTLEQHKLKLPAFVAKGD